MRSVMNWPTRGTCFFLCACLCAAPASGAMAGDTAAPLPTPTPLPVMEQLTSRPESNVVLGGVAETDGNADMSATAGNPQGTETVPAASPTPETSLTPGNTAGAAEASPTPGSTAGAPEASPTPGNTAGAPEASPTPGNTAGTPEASPTPGNTAGAPEASPSPKPTSGAPEASASPEPTATAPETSALPETTIGPVESLSPGAWDESLCDHMNENCELAPDCATEGCLHIGVNDAGDVVALCALGQWLMEAGASQDAGIMLLSASKPIEMALTDGENILYRSGSYRLTGGGENATLYVRGGMVVSLELAGVRLLTLRLSDGAVATMGFQGRSTIQTLSASGAAVTLNGSGSLTVANNLNCASLIVERGNVRLPASAASGNGRKPVVFAAQGAERATLEGKFWCYVKPDEYDEVTLWLPPPSDGSHYWGRMNGDTLEVSSLDEPPQEDGKVDLSSTGVFDAAAGKSYTLYASDPAKQSRTLNGAGGAAFTLADMGAAGNAPTFQGGGPTALYVSGTNYIASLSGPYAISGTGRLYIQNLNAPDLTVQGALSVCADAGGAPSAWTRVAVSGGGMSIDVTAEFSGGRVPALFFSGDLSAVYAPLPAPPAGYHYEGTLKNGKLVLEAVEDAQGSAVTLGANGVTLPSGNYRMVSEGGTSGTITVPDGAQVKLTLAGTFTSGGLNIGAGASVALVVRGANAVGALYVGGGANLSVSGEGALDASGASGGGTVTITGTTNLSLSSGGTLPGSALKPTVIAVTDSQNAPMSRKGIVLKLGKEEPFHATTGRSGHVTLWRQTALNGMDVVVLSEQDTYAAILNNGAASPDALPRITNLKASSYGFITFDTDTGNTLGVQYLVSDKEEEMEDTWSPTAGVALLRGGECTIPGLQDGDVVTFRAFACVQAGATLSGDTADAFAFSDKMVFTVKEVRQKLIIPDQKRTYNGNPFKLSSKLYPSGATVSYFKDGELMKSAPVKVGDYIARVTVPAGDAHYLPGTYEAKMTIKRIVVMIYPEFATKQKAQPDPDFFYTYDTSVMLNDDKVTGALSRAKGEAYGNYPYLAGSLSAPEYYELVISPDSPSFFIDWNIHHYLPYDPLARIDPVYDELRFSNGKTLRTQIRTIDVLKVGDTYYGTPVTDLIDGRERPATPTLRLRGGYDSALLILNAEPELNADGGYATDLNGERLVRGRRLTISYGMLNNLERQNVDYIAFGLDGVMVLVDLAELRSSEAVAGLMKQAGISKSSGTRFQVDLEPVTAGTQLAQSEAAAADAARLGVKLMRVSVRVSGGSQRVDIVPALQNARVFFDASGLLEDRTGGGREADITETVGGKPVSAGMTEREMKEQAAIAGAKGEAATSEELLDLTLEMLNNHIRRRSTTLLRYDGGEKALDTVAVVPYTSSESNLSMFRALMRTRPYLTAKFSKSGLYGLSEQAE